MFLHEHEPNFSGSIANTRKVLDAMSMSDAMSSVWETRQISQEYSSQVLLRSFPPMRLFLLSVLVQLLRCVLGRQCSTTTELIVSVGYFNFPL